MKIKAIILSMLLILVCTFFFACGTVKDADDTESNIQDTESSIQSAESDVNDTEAAVETTDATDENKVLLGDIDASQYVIVTNDKTAKVIAEYFSDSVKAITGAEMTIVTEALENENLIFIGTSDLLPESNLQKDEFLIKFVDGDLYIVYYEGSASYRAVTTILDEALFSDGSANLSSSFEAKGKCGDYIIGDNEFNPFE